jgi:SAM-dependent methyltransferase
VIGHGIDREELQANTRLDGHWVQHLNVYPRLPLEDTSVDAVLIVAGWQYLQQPEAVAADLLRVVRPHGQVIVAFSNRIFFQKAPQILTDCTDRDHLV